MRATMLVPVFFYFVFGSGLFVFFKVTMMQTCRFFGYLCMYI